MTEENNQGETERDRMNKALMESAPRMYELTKMITKNCPGCGEIPFFTSHNPGCEEAREIIARVDGRPGTERPGTERPGTERPGTERPGTERPGTERPGTERPGTERHEQRAETLAEKAAMWVLPAFLLPGMIGLGVVTLNLSELALGGRVIPEQMAWAMPMTLIGAMGTITATSFLWARNRREAARQRNS